MTEKFRGGVGPGRFLKVLSALLIVVAIIWILKGFQQPTPIETVPAAPSYISVAMVSDGTGIDVSWRDNSDNETGFDISNGVKHLQVGPNQTSLLSSDWGRLSPRQRMCFRVSSYNTTGSSAPTAWDCITMPKEENSTAKSPEISKTPPKKIPRNRNPFSTGHERKRVKQEHERDQHEAAERRRQERQEKRRLASIIDTEIRDNLNMAQIQQILQYERIGTSWKWKNTSTNDTIFATITGSNPFPPCLEFKISLLGKYNTRVERMKKACRGRNDVWIW